MSISLFIKKKFISIAPIFFQKLRFFKRTRYWPSTSNPRTINEILFCLKINSNENDYIYVDKLLVRNCIEKIIHENGFELLKLPQILTENENDEQFIKNLPDQPCFLKSNHGSGMSVYYDPNQGLPAEDQSFVKSWLDLDYAVYSGEKCYSKIDRKLFAENPIKCKDGSLPDDIKVHCYCGQPAVIQVLRRTKGYLERQTFDEKWQPRKWFQNEVLETDLSLVPMKEVIEYSTKLAEQFKYVRVDLYLVDGMLYFSELTLYPASASLPLISRNVDKELGEEFQRKCKLNSGDQS